MTANQDHPPQAPALLGTLAEQFWRAADRRLRQVIESEVTRITAPVIRGGKLVASALSGVIPLASLPAHKTSHESGGSDALTGSLDATARLQIATDGTLRGTRRQLNLVAGSGISLTGSDNAAAERVDVTITNTVAGSGGAPAAARYVTTAADATLTNEVVIPGLAGSADIAGSFGTGISDEYDTTTVDLTWTPSAPAQVDSNTTRPSHLYIRATDGTERFGLKNWTPAGAFDARARIITGDALGSDVGALGLCIANSDLSLRLLVQVYNERSYNRVLLNGASYSGGAWTARGSFPAYGVRSAYCRITRDSGTTVTLYWSEDGYSWVIITSFTFTITVAKIGYRVANNAIQGYVDWLRTDV